MTQKDPAPRQLLDDAMSGTPGWSQPYGGAAGVERLAREMLEDLTEQARLLGELRGFALVELLRTQSVSQLARERGVSRQAIEKVARRAPGTITW
ncbi:MAG: hypothetical protein Q4G34_00975 [Micrococcus sp.]|nr:hypothetical protein [Micrococcus sp.]